MPRVDTLLTVEERLALAAQTHTPAQVARHFAAHVGLFGHRPDFDALARQTSNLYAAASAEAANRFRDRLDRRLSDRHRSPVHWDAGPTGGAHDRRV